MTLVLIMFGTRGCNWLPENRIKASIFSQIVVLDANEADKIYPSKEYVDLVSEGSVNLGLSMRKAEPKSYYFYNESSFDQTRCAHVTFMTDGVVSVLKPTKANVKAKSHISDLWLPIIHVPGDSSFISFANDVEAQIHYYGLNKSFIFKNLKDSGFAQTVPIEQDGEKRNIHAFKFTSERGNFTFRARVYKSSLQLLYIAEDLEN